MSPLDNVGDLRIILSETLMAWRGGRGVLEVSDKMPSWTEFYQSLEKPPQKGFCLFSLLLLVTELDKEAIRVPVFRWKGSAWTRYGDRAS